MAPNLATAEATYSQAVKKLKVACTFLEGQLSPPEPGEVITIPTDRPEARVLLRLVDIANKSWSRLNQIRELIMNALIRSSLVRRLLRIAKQQLRWLLELVNQMVESFSVIWMT